MRTATKLGLYGVGLVVAFTGALGAGRLVGPSEDPPPAGHAEAGGHAETEGHEGIEEFPGGLQVSEAGYRLVPETTALPAGTTAEFRFRILGPDGAPVTGYTPTHEKDLHLIVVRRDLSGFQHVHPSRTADGLWSIPLTVADPGQYRVFADFQPAGRDKGLTLGVDVPAAGDYRVRPLPAPGRAFDVDGYRVELAGTLQPGTSSKLTLTVTKDGRPVTDLQPYLGAYGHLVALRDGDLAYLHVHPEEATTAGPDVTFYAEVPSAGAYRLYLDFQHAGKVRTAEFTAVTS
ncbi:hypothetical protein GCM10009558_026150 [Virgisporangium aurantiacum]